MRKTLVSAAVERPARASASIVIVGGTAASLGLDAPHALPAMQGIAAPAEFPGPPAATGAFLKSLAASNVIVLALGAEGLTPAARQVCLLGWHVHGALPIFVPGPAGAAVNQSIESYAAALGTPHPVLIADAPNLPAAIQLAVRRLDERDAAGPLRMAIAEPDNGEGAAVAGCLIAGVAEPGVEIVVLPQIILARVTGIEDKDSRQILHLDRPLATEPGQILAAAAARPENADQVAAHIVWIDDHPLLPGRPYQLRLAGQTATTQISALKHKIDPAGLEPIAARRLEAGEVGLCNLSFAVPLFFDQMPLDRQTGDGLSRFTIVDSSTGDTLGIGQVLFTLRRATNIHWQALAVDKAARAALKAQRPCCLWFTGLSGSGKSTVASLLEKRLNAMSRHTYTLDGDNVRHGLNRDLGFTDADRVENIRRIAEVSKLFVDAGLIVMVSFISPFRAERDMARALFAPGEFLEIHVDTPIGVCERRDPKGLYKKARAGQLKNFTGIDSPYEPPRRAEIRLDGGGMTPEALVEHVLKELARRGLVDLVPLGPD